MMGASCVSGPLMVFSKELGYIVIDNQEVVVRYLPLVGYPHISGRNDIEAISLA